MNKRFYDRVLEGDLSFIVGPCVFEGKEHMDDMYGQIKEIMQNNCPINWIYKTSFDKANRTSIDSFRGKDFDLTIQAFQDYKEKGFEIITDVHESWQCNIPVSMLQIPAFLCRQTDLLEAAAKSGKPVNIKKGQFLSPYEIKNVVRKMEHFGCREMMLTERGSSFGYNNLVVDMRSLKIMSDYGYPVVFDATHSCQSPGGLGTTSGGDREMAPILANAAIGTGCINTVFMEVHNDPDNAPSDGPNMIHIDNLEEIIRKLWYIYEVHNESR